MYERKDIKIPCEIWSRTVGFFRPYSNMNAGKQSEMKDRRCLLTKNYIMQRKNNDTEKKSIV
jgi:hypothetical protein